MIDSNQIKKAVSRLFKGLPIIITLVVLAFLGAQYFLKHTPSIYQSSAKIKLDDQITGVSNNKLFEDFDHFSVMNKVEAEIELIKSSLLIERAISSIGYNVNAFQVDGSKEIQLDYNRLPFKIELNQNNWIYTENELLIEFINTDSATCTLNGDTHTVELNHINRYDAFTLTNVDLDEAAGKVYLLQFADIKKTISEVKQNLFVKQVDKDVAVIKLYFKDENPERGAKFLNALCGVFINDHIQQRTSAAKTTTSFIDDQLTEIAIKLKSAENEIEEYKLQNNIVDTRQEAETGLRKLSDLKVQLINLRMNEKAIDRLEKSIDSDNYFAESALSIGFGDLVVAELMKNLKLASDERDNLLLRFKPNHEKVIAQNKKIEKVKTYINNALTSAKADIAQKSRSIELALAEEDKEFDNFPTKLKQLNILEREFKLNENLYMFLMKKRNESAIASAANISFHRIIENAVAKKDPFSPNETLITFASVTASFLLSLFIIFLLSNLSGRITSKEDLEEHTNIPIIGTLKKIKNGLIKETDFGTIATALKANSMFKENNVICVNSSLRKEGKSTMALNLAKSFSKFGYTTLLVDADFQNPSLHKELEVANDRGLSQLVTADFKDCIQNIGKNFSFLPSGNLMGSSFEVLSNKNLIPAFENLKNLYDVILVDTSASAISNEAITLNKFANINLIVVKAGKTQVNYALNAEMMCMQYSLNNCAFVLNQVSAATNYSGNYTSSKLSYNSSKSLIGGLIHKIKTYAA